MSKMKRNRNKVKHKSFRNKRICPNCGGWNLKKKDI